MTTSRENITSNLIIGFSGVVFFLLFIYWFFAPLPFALRESLPGEDNKPAGLVRESGAGVRIGEYFQNYSGTASEPVGAWPRFRGENCDNISAAPFALGENFTATVRWSVTLGEGHAAAAVADGRVYVLDYDETRRSDALRCFSAATGEEIWRRWYQVSIKRNHGISRSIPTVFGGFVVSMGPMAQVMCVDAQTGALRWGLDVAEEFSVEIPQWYTAQCPLVDEGEVVIACGGSALMCGLDLADGRVAWTTPNEAKIGMSHASVMPAVIAGKRVFLYAGIGGLAGVSAGKEDRGRLLFVHKDWDLSVVAPSPVPLPDGRVFLTAGYGGGSMMVQIAAGSTGWTTSTLFRHRPKEGLACEQQTPIFYDGFLYGVMPKDGGDLKNQFVCFNPNTGKIVWGTGKTLTFGLGPYIFADGKFLVLSESGALTALAATPEGFTVLGQAEVIPKAIDAWGPIAIAGQRLYLRDSTRLFCVELE